MLTICLFNAVEQYDLFWTCDKCHETMGRYITSIFIDLWHLLSVSKPRFLSPVYNIGSGTCSLLLGSQASCYPRNSSFGHKLMSPKWKTRRKTFLFTISLILLSCFPLNEHLQTQVVTDLQATRNYHIKIPPK